MQDGYFTAAPKLFVLLSTYLKDPEIILQPRYKQGFGVVYDVDGLLLTAEKIKDIENGGFLVTHGSVSFPSCPRCNSMQLHVEIICPSCNGRGISKSDLVIHYECNHVAPVEEFVTDRMSTYICPNCKKELKRVGIDYGRPGLGFRCITCGNISQYPLVRMVCDNNHIFKLDEVSLLSYHTYKISKQTATLARIGELLLSIQKMLKDSNLRSTILASVKGSSGVTHMIPLLVDGSQPIAVEFVVDSSGVEFELLQTILRYADYNAKVLLVVRNDILPVLKDMINPEKFILLVAIGEQEIPNLVVSEVLRIVHTH